MTEPEERSKIAIVLRPIGVVRSPFKDKASAPRQAVVAGDARGSIDLLPEYEDALSDLASWTHIWIVALFHHVKGHEARGFRSKVLPPRSETRRGVFSTRSPHRPNPIALSAVALEKVEGTHVFVRGLDLLDGTPVLDLKPYVAYADAIPGAGAGWLAADPVAGYAVAWSEGAARAAAFIDERLPSADPVDSFAARVTRLLALGPEPHAYRRIKKMGATYRLSHKDFRVDFSCDVAARRVEVNAVVSGYRPRDLALGEGAAIEMHRAFVAAFGA